VPERVCAECRKSFEVPIVLDTNGKHRLPSKRLTCSRSCAVALAWKKDPAKRLASLKRCKQTPEEMDRIKRHNETRWAKEGERERLSEWNRRRWAKPAVKAKLSAAIRKAQRRPEVRAAASITRMDLWRTPEYRNKNVAAIQRAHGSPEYRAKFSEMLRERWKDPVWRAKVSAINAERVRSPEFRAVMAERLRDRWASDPVFRETVLSSVRFLNTLPEELERKSSVMKALWADPVWRLRQCNIIGKANPRFAPRRDKQLARTADLLALVERAVPSALPDYARADITQDIFLALLEGEMALADLAAGSKVMLAKYRKLFPDKYGPLSLDAPIADGSGTTYMDLLDSETVHF
jgi:hypothetical protein